MILMKELLKINLNTPQDQAQRLGLVKKPGFGLWGPPGDENPASHRTSDGIVKPLLRTASSPKNAPEQGTIDVKSTNQTQGSIEPDLIRTWEAYIKKYNLIPYTPKTSEEELIRLEKMAGILSTEPGPEIMPEELFIERKKTIEEHLYILNDNIELATVVTGNTNASTAYSDNSQNSFFLQTIRSAAANIILGLDAGETIPNNESIIKSVSQVFGRKNPIRIANVTAEWRRVRQIFEKKLGAWIPENQKKGLPEEIMFEGWDLPTADEQRKKNIIRRDQRSRGLFPGQIDNDLSLSVPISTFNHKQLQGLRTLIHETVHSIRHEHNRLRRMQETPSGYALDEGVTEYITFGILAGLLNPEQYDNFLTEEMKNHPYAHFYNAVHVMARHGGFDVLDYMSDDNYSLVDGQKLRQYKAWRDSPYFSPFEQRPLPPPPVRRYNVTTKAIEAQKQAIQNIFKKLNIDEEIINNFVQVIDKFFEPDNKQDMAFCNRDFIKEFSKLADAVNSGKDIISKEYMEAVEAGNKELAEQIKQKYILNLYNLFKDGPRSATTKY
jgi:hypothetical protein